MILFDLYLIKYNDPSLAFIFYIDKILTSNKNFKFIVTYKQEF